MASAMDSASLRVSGRPATGGGPVPQAAVALVLRREPEPALLLVRRARSPRDPWSGQMALPGGRRDPEDPDLRATAVRETLEEVGIDLDRSGALLGRLPKLEPASRAIPRLVIAPFVFLLAGGVDARVASTEIAAVYWVPVAALTVRGARSEVEVDTPAGRRDFPCYRVSGHPVWGLTYRILRRFLRGRLARPWPTAGDGDGAGAQGPPRSTTPSRIQTGAPSEDR